MKTKIVRLKRNAKGRFVSMKKSKKHTKRKHRKGKGKGKYLNA